MTSKRPTHTIFVPPSLGHPIPALQRGLDSLKTQGRFSSPWPLNNYPNISQKVPIAGLFPKNKNAILMPILEIRYHYRTLILFDIFNERIL